MQEDEPEEREDGPELSFRTSLLTALQKERAILLIRMNFKPWMQCPLLSSRVHPCN